jgi:prepilin-type N-terminal cleavage/methylation domain-containing protein
MTARKPDRRDTAFTLIEVLVVIGIIALLIAILVPSLIKARLMAQQAACLCNLKQIGLGMVSYAQSNQGSMPAGPAEAMYWMNTKTPNNPQFSSTPKTESDWRAFMYEPWQWGGHRGLYEWLPDETWTKTIPETKVRPLTPYIYRSARLDSKTPVFECPADKGLDYWQKVDRYQDSNGQWTGWATLPYGRRPVHEMVGNSYVVYNWDDKAHTVEQAIGIRRDAGKIALVMEGVLYYDQRYFTYEATNPDDTVRQAGWHGFDRMYNILLLDLHGEFKFINKLAGGTNRAPGLRFLEYGFLMDYYR